MEDYRADAHDRGPESCDHVMVIGTVIVVLMLGPVVGGGRMMTARCIGGGAWGVLLTPPSGRC